MKAIVRTKKGDKGIIDTRQPLIKGKRQVNILSADMKPTKENRLCDALSLIVVGYVD